MIALNEGNSNKSMSLFIVYTTPFNTAEATEE